MVDRVKAAGRTDEELAAGEAFLALMERRRSAGASLIGEPGPNTDELRRLLAIACRAPDHGALEPWRFIVIEGEARAEASRRLGECYLAENAAMAPDRLQKFSAIVSRIFNAAPVVVMVVSKPDVEAAIPVFEQELSAGAVCMNLLMAAHAMGFDADWVSGFAANSEGARAILGIGPGEKTAGVVFIGAAKKRPVERKRPDLDAVATWWTARD